MTLTVEGISLHGCEIVDLQHSDFLKVGYGCRCNGAVLHFALDKDRVWRLISWKDYMGETVK